MGKPLGYYTSYVPGNESYLDEMQKQYGCCLNKLSRREQLYVIHSLIDRLFMNEGTAIRDEVFEVAAECDRNLSISDIEGVCEALINQIRWGSDDTKANT